MGVFHNTLLTLIVAFADKFGVNEFAAFIGIHVCVDGARSFAGFDYRFGEGGVGFVGGWGAAHDLGYGQVLYHRAGAVFGGDGGAVDCYDGFVLVGAGFDVYRGVSIVLENQIRLA